MGERAYPPSLVPVEHLLRPSWSMYFGDVSEMNDHDNQKLAQST